MTLIFKVDLGITKMHPCAKFHEPEFTGLDFRGLNTFGVRALEKKEKKKKKETNSVKLYKVICSHCEKICLRGGRI